MGIDVKGTCLLGHPVYGYRCKRYQSHVYLDTLYIALNVKGTKAMFIGTPCLFALT